jgi:hypothetical protein
MRLQTRKFKLSDTDYKKQIILIAESEQESHAIDLMLGDCGKGPVAVMGEVTLADGYTEHYIRLERSHDQT